MFLPSPLQGAGKHIVEGRAHAQMSVYLNVPATCSDGVQSCLLNYLSRLWTWEQHALYGVSSKRNQGIKHLCLSNSPADPRPAEGSVQEKRRLPECISDSSREGETRPAYRALGSVHVYVHTHIYIYMHKK